MTEAPISDLRVVHYPLFAVVGREGFAAQQAVHSRLATLVVASFLLLEAASAPGSARAALVLWMLARAWARWRGRR